MNAPAASPPTKAGPRHPHPRHWASAVVGVAMAVTASVAAVARAVRVVLMTVTSWIAEARPTRELKKEFQVLGKQELNGDVRARFAALAVAAATAPNPKFARRCRESNREPRVQRGTGIIEVLVSLDSEVRMRMPRVLANFGVGTLGARYRSTHTQRHAGRDHENRWPMPLRLHRLRGRGRPGADLDLPLHRLPDAVGLSLSPVRPRTGGQLSAHRGRAGGLREDRRKWIQARAGLLSALRHIDLCDLGRRRPQGLQRPRRQRAPA